VSNPVRVKKPAAVLADQAAPESWGARQSACRGAGRGIVADTINTRDGTAQFFVVPPAGFEPALPPPEGSADTTLDIALTCANCRLVAMRGVILVRIWHEVRPSESALHVPECRRNVGAGCSAEQMPALRRAAP
jgi:hypothetical protein